jgi:hypothetical protein
MLTPTAAWLQAASTANEPRVLFSIDNGVDPAWKALSGYCSRFEYPIAVTGVSSIGAEIDPLTRATQTNECVVEVSDTWVRPILVSKRIKGKKASILYGFAEIEESDFLPLMCGPIGEVAFEGGKDSGIASISIMDLMSIFEDHMVCGSWVNKHPLQILYDGKVADPMSGTLGGRSILSQCGYDSSTWVDESTFDPTDAAYSGSISHWCISRVSPYDVYQPSSAADLINDLCRVLMGSIVPDESGVLGFKRWDPVSVAVDTFTVDDILPGSFRQEPLDSNVVNRVVIKLAANSDTGGSSIENPKFAYAEQTLEINDTDSQTAYAYPGQTARVISNEFASAFAPPHFVELYADITAGSSSLSAQGEIHGWAGMRGKYQENVEDTFSLVDFYTNTPQDATATISASRPAYLLLDNVFRIGSESEIVKVTAGGSASAGLGAEWSGRTLDVNDYYLGSWVQSAYWNDYTATSITRAQFGTSARAHVKYGASGAGSLQHTLVWDVTCLVDSAEKTINRFKYGCPIVEFETPCHKMALQYADTVGLVLPDFLAYGFDGVTSATWEIVGKEVDPLASPPKIKWRLAMNATTPASYASPRISIRSLWVHSDRRIWTQGINIRWEVFVTYGGRRDIGSVRGNSSCIKGHLYRICPKAQNIWIHTREQRSGCSYPAGFLGMGCKVCHERYRRYQYC